MPSPSPWRWPTSSRASSPRPAHLQHSYSLADFHSPSGRGWISSPPSPTPSDVSLSRSATPSNPWGRSDKASISRSNSRDRSRIDSPMANDLSDTNMKGFSATAAYAKQYWSSLPSAEMRGRSDSVSTTSTIRDRSTTPPARSSKLPARRYTDSLIDLTEDTEALSIHTSPFAVEPDLNSFSVPLSPRSPAEKPVKLNLPAPAPSIYNHVARSQLMRILPGVIGKSGWQPSKRNELYTWAIHNPKSAILLLWMCDDGDAWTRAVFYGITDKMLPFQESNLVGIATNASEVVQKQWRVMARELPRNGDHFELTRQEAAPFEEVDTLSSDSNGSSRLDRVRWVGSQALHGNGNLVARKTITTRSHKQKLFLLDSIKGYNRLNSDNIAKILVSYSQGPTISVVTPLAIQSLATFLRATSKPSSSATFAWIHQLTQAIAYIHSKDLHYGSLRPSKVLIDGYGRIFLSVFGISASPNAQYTSVQEERYVYAAPERLSPHSKPTKAADIYSLGCLFLEVFTAALGVPFAPFVAYRAAGKANGDASFHANPERVRAWMQQLFRNPTSSTAAAENRTARGFPALLGQMLVLEPGNRIRTRKLAVEVARWESERVGVKEWEKTSEGWRSAGA